MARTKSDSQNDRKGNGRWGRSYGASCSVRGNVAGCVVLLTIALGSDDYLLMVSVVMGAMLGSCICGLDGQGRDKQAIAEKLYISEGTVKVHSRNIYQKMGIHSKQELIDLVERTEDSIKE